MNVIPRNLIHKKLFKLQFISLFQASGFGYTVGANLDRNEQLVYSLSNNHVTQSTLYSSSDQSQNVGHYFMSGSQSGTYESRPEQLIATSSHHMNGHMAQSSYDDPVDLSNGKLVNGVIKEERQLDRQQHMFSVHNGIRVGIPAEQGNIISATSRRLLLFCQENVKKLFNF